MNSKIQTSYESHVPRSLHRRFFRVLDHGFVGVIDHMGDDQAIEEFARVSRGPRSEPVSSLRGLIRYLTRKRHLGVMERAEAVFHCRLPIFVARQWVRHRTASLNEQSGRFTILDPECYLGDDLTAQCFESYLARIEAGSLKEDARRVLPVSTYTEWQWKVDLRNLFHFLELRMAPDAQKEIREYAWIIAALVRELYPIAFESWWDYVFESFTFSKMERRALADRLRTGNYLDRYGMSENEWRDFEEKIEFLDAFHDLPEIPWSDEVRL